MASVHMVSLEKSNRKKKGGADHHQDQGRIDPTTAASGGIWTGSVGGYLKQTH